MITLKVLNKEDEILTIGQGESITLVHNQEYQEGDHIVLESEQANSYIILQLDDAIGKHLVYIKDHTMSFTIPFGEKKACYSPKSFWGNIHVLSARIATTEEINCYQNLALNPYDCHESRNCFPHSSANVETRGESVFASKNAINGNHANLSHGLWPYESWGINQNPDATIKIEFGRIVNVNQVTLFLRADFPHDSYWTNATLRFSDNTTLDFPLIKSADGQIVTFDKRKIEWVQLEKLIKADDESPFPALSQIEVYGTNL